MVNRATTTGYIYCIVNEYMPGICKVGFTSRPVDARLKEANQSHTWSPPSYKIAFAKRVKDAKYAETKIHELIDSCRIMKRKEMFTISPQLVFLHFEKIEGELCMIDETFVNTSFVYNIEYPIRVNIVKLVKVLKNEYTLT